MDILGSVHYTEKFENAAFTSTVKPTINTNSSRKRSFSKKLFQAEEIENAGFQFSCGRKTFSKRDCSKAMAPK